MKLASSWAVGSELYGQSVPLIWRTERAPAPEEMNRPRQTRATPNGRYADSHVSGHGFSTYAIGMYFGDYMFS